MIGMTEKFGMYNWHSSDDAQLIDEAKVPVARAALHWPSVGPWDSSWQHKPSRCLQHSYWFVESFCRQSAVHGDAQGFYIMFFFKMLLGAWCRNLLLDVTGANRNYGVSWRKGVLLTRVSQGTPDTIYHQNHELFVSCCVKSVWMIASVCLHSCSFLFWLAKLFVS